jgi:hypothetical protein
MKPLDPIKDYDEITKWINMEKECKVVSDDKRYDLQIYSDNYFMISDSPDWTFFRKAWDFADMRNEQHYENHLTFKVIKCSCTYFVIEKHDLDRLKISI